MKRIASGGPFEAKIGYVRAVVAGGWVHVSGTCAEGPDVVSQCRAALATIEGALKEAGAGFEHAVRVNYILPNKADFEPCWPVLREAFGDNPPAATMIEANLIDPKFLIEIELTCYIGP